MLTATLLKLVQFLAGGGDAEERRKTMMEARLSYPAAGRRRVPISACTEAVRLERRGAKANNLAVLMPGLESLPLVAIAAIACLFGSRIRARADAQTYRGWLRKFLWVMVMLLLGQFAQLMLLRGS
jgi:hypothetical protein